MRAWKLLLLLLIWTLTHTERAEIMQFSSKAKDDVQRMFIEFSTKSQVNVELNKRSHLAFCLDFACISLYSTTTDLAY